MEELGENVEDAVKDGGGRDEGRLNNLIAILVVLTATIMALTSIKGAVVLQEASILHTEINDAWDYYEAKSVKGHLAENTLDLLRALAVRDPGTARALAPSTLRQEAALKTYDQEKSALEQEAKGLEKRAAGLDRRHETFSVAEALLSVAICLFGLSALTRHRGLLWVGAALALAGLGTSLLAAFGSWA